MVPVAQSFNSVRKLAHAHAHSLSGSPVQPSVQSSEAAAATRGVYHTLASAEQYTTVPIND